MGTLFLPSQGFCEDQQTGDLTKTCEACCLLLSEPQKEKRQAVELHELQSAPAAPPQPWASVVLCLILSSSFRYSGPGLEATVFPLSFPILLGLRASSKRYLSAYLSIPGTF